MWRPNVNQSDSSSVTSLSSVAIEAKAFDEKVVRWRQSSQYFTI